ncbi:MAG: ribosome silencing factor [Opitutales bacterium]|nr:ribosome silencing factor [Opitutales bacterium]
MIEVSSEKDSKEISIQELLKACCQALDDKKAEDLKILHLGQRSSIADYFVIATGNSSPHLRALRNVVEKALDELGAEIVGMDTDCSSGWAVLDAGNIIFHMFTPHMRELYALESLWKDADIVKVELQ